MPYADVLAAHREVLKALRQKAEEILNASGFRPAPDLLTRVVHDLRAGISSPESRASHRERPPRARPGRGQRGEPVRGRARARRRPRRRRPRRRPSRKPGRTTAPRRRRMSTGRGRRRRPAREKRPVNGTKPARATRRGPFSGAASRTCESGWRRRGPRTSGTNDSSRRRAGPWRPRPGFEGSRAPRSRLSRAALAEVAAALEAAEGDRPARARRRAPVAPGLPTSRSLR